MRLETCSCLAGKGLFKNLDVGDEGLLTAGFEEIDNGFDFGPHASAWENTWLLEFPGFFQVEAADVLLIGLLVIEFNPCLLYTSDAADD